jgi:hypothetical protein
MARTTLLLRLLIISSYQTPLYNIQTMMRPDASLVVSFSLASFHVQQTTGADAKSATQTTLKRGPNLDGPPEFGSWLGWKERRDHAQRSPPHLEILPEHPIPVQQRRHRQPQPPVSKP